MAEGDDISEAAHKCRQMLDGCRLQGLEPGQEDGEQQQVGSIRSNEASRQE